MKKYIKAATSYHNITNLENWHGLGVSYMVRYTDPDDRGNFGFQITRISPYDDADYVWAKKEDLRPVVVFIQDGNIIDRMTLWSYEPDEYEDVDEYIDGVVDEVIAELSEFNKGIEPKIIHN